MRSARVIFACVAAVLVATVLTGDPFAASPAAGIKQKRAQAGQVLAQVNQLDDQFGRTVEAWNGARYELTLARRQLTVDRAQLAVAKRQQALAQRRIRERLVGLYESSDQPTTIAILLGSATVSQMISRLSAARAVTDADHSLAVETAVARRRYTAAAHAAQQVAERKAAAVSQLDYQRRQISTLLARRKELLSHIQGQIATLQAQEARQQALLAAQARARLAAEQERLRVEAAARADAAARAAAAQAAAAQAAAKAAPPATNTAPTTTAAAPTTTASAPTTTAPEVPPAAATTTAPAPAPVPAAPTIAGHPEAASIAMRYLGIKYVWGGASTSGFDCSGLVMYVFAQLGISLPHYAAAQYGFGTPVAKSDLQPGDLVFFDGLSHVGIYIGGGDMIHAPHTGDVVKISPISEFGSNYVGARRI